MDLKLVTPGRGTIELSDSKDPQLFRLAKVGLGLLGVASEITLQCVPAHSLLEHTFVVTAKVRLPPTRDQQPIRARMQSHHRLLS